MADDGKAPDEPSKTKSDVKPGVESTTVEGPAAPERTTSTEATTVNSESTERIFGTEKVRTLHREEIRLTNPSFFAVKRSYAELARGKARLPALLHRLRWQAMIRRKLRLEDGANQYLPGGSMPIARSGPVMSMSD